ncbi:bifunctional riboflavin kinase/FAD synthetase [Orrella daihaiensis]|uniref:Riboflavin biosynthesis protein n=1 Tax=Orrella daihaiensis TaxID=2782176 RepID=A0ABY4AG40_9BURK|nr:bifunctional riboflavin kinase/FAD synthetase [Orrella daihaiensis]UOD49258.1 bifunctional riboflavin kinase/FAD synthetase [Orrella daihaiensis]
MKPFPFAARIIRHLPARPPVAASALTIGNLDGVHLGHLAMLDRVRQAAKRRELSPSVLTFAPHPRAYFAKLQGVPHNAPLQINGLRDKLARIASAGIEQIALLRFNAAMAQMSPEHFVRTLLFDQLAMRWLMVGSDFRFGHRRAGDISLLSRLAKELGFELEILSEVVDQDGQRISSSQVRQAMQAGDMPRVATLLGQPWRLSGRVLHGKKLGRTLGFPTLNLKVSSNTAARFGIYIVRVHGLNARPLPGIASLGRRPTVDDDLGVLLETHILDADIDAYGKLVSVELLQHVRDEQKFPDLTSLTDAMQGDRQHAKDYFAHHGL